MIGKFFQNKFDYFLLRFNIGFGNNAALAFFYGVFAYFAAVTEQYIARFVQSFV
jgi:hypothetical protein